MAHQGADVAVITVVWGGQHTAVMLAKAAQGFFQAEIFQERQAEGFARAFVLPGGVMHVAIAKGAGLVLVVLRNKSQGLGEHKMLAVQLGAKVV